MLTGTGPDLRTCVDPPPERLADDDLALLLMIRQVERALLTLFAEGELSGTVHTCLGQEHVPVALRPLLSSADYEFSNHRGHGHYLARFADPEGLLAEIMGRDGAVCGGFGGTQHILRGRYMSTGVQGESLPVAAGVALRLRDAEPGVLCIVHVGDGTWGEGAVYEALNVAALWRLPLLVAVENNGIAQSTPAEHHLAGTIAGRAAAFGIRHVRVDSTDVTAVRRVVGPEVAAVRASSRPLVLEFVTPRLGPHSKGDDTRDAQTMADLVERDWATRYAAAHPDHFAAEDARQRDRVARVLADIRRRPLVAPAATARATSGPAPLVPTS